MTVAVVAGCATGQAVRSAQTAADKGDWDSAVAYYRQALNSDPSRIDIKLALERSMRNASTDHLKRARAFEQQDQLSGAAAVPARRRSRSRQHARDHQGARDRAKDSRSDRGVAPALAHRRSAPAGGADVANPRLDPRVKVTANFNGSVRDLLTFIGPRRDQHHVRRDHPDHQQPIPDQREDASLEDVLNQIMAPTPDLQGQRAKSIFIYADSQANRSEVKISSCRSSTCRIPIRRRSCRSLRRFWDAGPAIRPIIYPNKTANAVQVKATAPVMRSSPAYPGERQAPRRGDDRRRDPRGRRQRRRTSVSSLELRARLLVLAGSGPAQHGRHLSAGGGAAIQPEHDQQRRESGGLLLTVPSR